MRCIIFPTHFFFLNLYQREIVHEFLLILCSYTDSIVEQITM